MFTYNKNDLPQMPSNAATIYNMVETKKYFPVPDLDAKHSKGHSKGTYWKRYYIGNGKYIMLETKI